MSVRQRQPDESVHDYQHELIDERVAALRAQPRRSGLDKLRRHEAYKRAAWTLRGHLSGCHDLRRVSGPPLTLEQLEAMHAGYHA